MLIKQEFIRCLKLDSYRSGKFVIVGTTCSGKSTLVKESKSFIDMDDVVFDKMTPEEQTRASQPWTPEIGQFMCEMTDRYLKDWKGVFCGTVVPKNATCIFFLKVSDAILKERCEKRNVSFQTALDMQDWISTQLSKMDLSRVTILVAEEKKVDQFHIRSVNIEWFNYMNRTRPIEMVEPLS